MRPGFSIKTLADAKSYFLEMGCSHFHMEREYPGLYDQYRMLGIGKEIEIQWADEEVSRLIEWLLSAGRFKKDLWAVHSELERVVSHHGFTQRLEEVLEASRAIELKASQWNALLMAETIAGRSAIRYRSGLIFLSYDSGQAALATGFAQLARRLVRNPFRSEVREVRRQKLLSVLDEVEAMQGAG